MPRNTIRGAPCNNKFPLLSLVSRTSVLAGAVNELAVCLEFMYPEHSPCSFAGFKLVVNQPRQRCAVPVGCLFQVVGMEVALAEHLVDRKSTRLNSSHVAISYAVFCLKKKTNTH